jgi:hypothetical protein
LNSVGNLEAVALADSHRSSLLRGFIDEWISSRSFNVSI